MKPKDLKNRIVLVKGDITEYPADVIVNAANSSLLGGSGVDGAIHKKGGKQIVEDCMKIRASQGKCNVGEAVITRAGNMPFKNVIHTVGPVWQSGKNNEAKLFAEKLLKNAYISSLELAEKNKLKNISFPNISTGVYRFPKDLAAKTAINAVVEYLEKNDFIEKVNFVCFENENFEIYKNRLDYILFQTKNTNFRNFDIFGYNIAFLSNKRNGKRL